MPERTLAIICCSSGIDRLDIDVAILCNGNTPLATLASLCKDLEYLEEDYLRCYQTFVASELTLLS